MVNFIKLNNFNENYNDKYYIKILIMNFRKIYKTRYSIIKQIFFVSKINSLKTKNENVKRLVNDGFLHLKNL